VEGHSAPVDWSKTDSEPSYQTLWVRRPRNPACANFAVHLFALTSTQGGRVLLPATSNSALIAAQDGVPMLVDKTGTHEISSPPGLPHVQGYQDAAKRFSVIGSAGGNIAQYSREIGFCPIQTSSDSSRPFDLGANPTYSYPTFWEEDRWQHQSFQTSPM
jgi:hypothetical protein